MHLVFSRQELARVPKEGIKSTGINKKIIFVTKKGISGTIVEINNTVMILRNTR